MKKKITKTVTHDWLAVSGTYASGGSFRFSVGRSGERLSWAGSNGPKASAAQLKKFVEFCKFRNGETNGQRIERIHDAAQRAGTCAEFVALMD